MPWPSSCRRVPQSLSPGSAWQATYKNLFSTSVAHAGILDDLLRVGSVVPQARAQCFSGPARWEFLVAQGQGAPVRAAGGVLRARPQGGALLRQTSGGPLGPALFWAEMHRAACSSFLAGVARDVYLAGASGMGPCGPAVPIPMRPDTRRPARSSTTLVEARRRGSASRLRAAGGQARRLRRARTPAAQPARGRAPQGERR